MGGPGCDFPAGLKFSEKSKSTVNGWQEDFVIWDRFYIMLWGPCILEMFETLKSHLLMATLLYSGMKKFLF